MENNKTMILSILGVLVLVIAVVGVSFAMYSFSAQGTKENVITTGSVSLSIDKKGQSLFTLDNALIKWFSVIVWELSKKAANYEKSVLVLHQGIDKYFGYQYELELGDVPDNFSYYALGHVHKYVNDSFGNGRLVYPGSTEIWKTDELEDYKNNGKGCVIVDFDGPKPVIKRLSIDAGREFIIRTIDYNKLESNVAGIKEIIKDFDKKPILDLTIKNVDGNTKDIYEIINNELGDLALMIRPKFEIIDENRTGDPPFPGSVGPKELIVEQLEKYNDKNVEQFALELYDFLSKDKNGESKELVHQFFNDHYSKNPKYCNVEEVEEIEVPKKESGDIQVTFNEVLKWFSQN